MNSNQTPSLAIIGAGPAGIYLTIQLKNWPGEIHLYEQNSDIGEKLKTTGGGRMNVTNQLFGADQFSTYGSSNRLKKLFKNPHFKNRHHIFEALGIEYTWEKQRAILTSQNAPAEVARLKELIQNQSNAHIHLNHKATNIQKKQNHFEIQFKNQPPQTHNFLTLSGGAMFRLKDLGPKEKIYQLPQQLGHTITNVSPSLSPLIFTDKALRTLSGISFEGTLTDPKNQKSITNDILITHFGLSGPAVLDFSAYRENDFCQLSFIPKTQQETVEQDFQTKRSGKHLCRSFLRQYVPQRLADFLLEKSDIAKDQNIADVSKQSAKQLMQHLFAYRIKNLQAKNYPNSWTTKGGIDLSEINTKNLESKLVPDCFFAGEIIDINGLCGGYNISFAAISAQIVADHLFSKIPS